MSARLSPVMAAPACWLRVAIVCAAALSFSACGSSGQEEMQAWMARQRASLKPSVDPIPQPLPFMPRGYDQARAVDPFSPQKLALALHRDANLAAATSALVAPELKRRKEVLEGYPLDTMTLVGSLLKQGRPIALIKVDNQLYQVAVGQHLGQNYGRVQRITEQEVHIRELVRDPAGTWVERPATLQLQERAK